MRKGRERRDAMLEAIAAGDKDIRQLAERFAVLPDLEGAAVEARPGIVWYLPGEPVLLEASLLEIEGDELLGVHHRIDLVPEVIAAAAVLAVLATARREACIYMRELEADIYDHAEVIEALKQIAIAGPNSSVRILIQEPTGARADGHRLVALSQRLSSSFAFRTPIEEIDQQYAGCFVISDRGGWFERTLASRFDGEGSTRGPGRKAQLQEMFNAVWERSVELTEMRRLEI